jgi:hypothetical protein
MDPAKSDELSGLRSQDRHGENVNKKRTTRSKMSAGIVAFVTASLFLAVGIFGVAGAASSPRVTVNPAVGLRNGQTVLVSGTGFKAKDHVYVVECLRKATGASQCKTLSAIPVTITATGVLPATKFKVATGKIGNGACGTALSNVNSCDISVGNAQGGDSATAPITFAFIKTVKFTGSYSGTIGLLMNGTPGQAASTVSVASLSGTGSGTYLGTSRLSGNAPNAINASAQCAYAYTGTGSIVGASSRLLLKVVVSQKNSACAADTLTPTSVAVSGTATVTSGTGKFARVSGTLKFTGSFMVQSNTVSGTKEADHFTANLTGTLTIRS